MCERINYCLRQARLPVDLVGIVILLPKVMLFGAAGFAEEKGVSVFLHFGPPVGVFR